MSKLIFGCGYLGSRVARLWQIAGEEVAVVTRSASRGQELAAAGFQSIVADVLDPASLRNLPAADTVLYAVGFDRAAGGSIQEVYAGGLAMVLAALPGDARRVIYISTTGVYGQSGGAEVNEDSPTEPLREGGRASLAAEQVLASSSFGPRGIVLRMAGLYGPGRIPLADAIRRGEPIAAPATGTLNLIHVEDAARVVLAAEARANPPRTYVVSDGQPAVRGEYYAELARLLGAPPPTFTEPDANSPAAARAASDKRVDSRRMFAELGVDLAYPNYREGLAAIVAAEE